MIRKVKHYPKDTELMVVCGDCGKELGDNTQIRFCVNCCKLWIYARDYLR